jgi:hypothetical protein
MRTRVPANIEGQLLLGCRRRCAICYGLNRDSSEKRGQIAHLDRDHSNNKIENLAFLCLDHHDQYDGVPSQSKRLTLTEVRVFKAELEDHLAAALAAPLILASQTPPGRGARLEPWVGVYRAEVGESSAELEVQEDGEGRYRVKGIAFYGISSNLGPNIGELDATGRIEGDCLVATMRDYFLSLRLAPPGVVGEETMPHGRSPFGLNVSFAMSYTKVPQGGDVLLQPERRPFESEFWPEEGIPDFVAKVETLFLYARPAADAPIVAEWAVSLGAPIPFDGFRYRTIRPGVIVAKLDCKLVGRNLGRTDYVSHSNYYRDGGESITVQLRPGDRIEYLQYRAEGTAFMRWQGLALDAPIPVPGTFDTACLPVAESWVRVIDPNKGNSGWVLAEDQLEEIHHQF